MDRSYKDEPMISIIVPVYNTERYLPRCIESLVGQTLKDIQIVLVDDGSTDNSLGVCRKYADKDKRIIVIHKDNAGQGLARNAGIVVASGKYISFLDSDDYYEKEACEIMVDIMESNDADICSYGYRIDDKEGNLVISPTIRDRIYIGDEVKEEFILHYFGDSMTDDNLRGVSSCMSIFRKDIIITNGLTYPSEREVYSEDTFFSLKYCEHVKRAVASSRVLYHYCQNESSFSKGYREDRFYLTKNILKYLKEYATANDMYDRVKDRIGMTAWVNLITCLKQDYRHLSYRKSISNMKSYFHDEIVLDSLSKFDSANLPIKQKLLYWAINIKLYFVVYILVMIRAKAKL